MQQPGRGPCARDRARRELQRRRKIGSAQHHHAQRHDIGQRAQQPGQFGDGIPLPADLGLVHKLGAVRHDLRGLDFQIADAARQRDRLQHDLHARLGKLRGVQAEHQVFREIAGKKVPVSPKEKRPLRVTLAADRCHAVIALRDEYQGVALAGLQQHGRHRHGGFSRVALEIATSDRDARQRLLQRRLAALGLANGQMHITAAADLRELQAHVRQPQGIRYQKALRNDGAVEVGRDSLQLVVRLLPGHAIAIGRDVAVLRPVVAPKAGAPPAAVIVVPVARVLLGHCRLVLAQHLALHLILAQADVAAIAAGLYAGLAGVGGQHQIGGGARDRRFIGIEQRQVGDGAGRGREQQAIEHGCRVARAGNIGFARIAEVIGLIATVGARQVGFGLEPRDIVGQLDDGLTLDHAVGALAQRGQIGGDRADTWLRLGAPGLLLMQAQRMLEKLGQARAVLHLDALDAGGHQINQRNRQRGGLYRRRLRVYALGARLQVDIGPAHARHRHGLGLGRAAGQVDEEIARLDLGIGFLAPNHDGHAALCHQRQVLEQVQRFELLADIDLAVIEET